ncbi:MAG: AfsR/SARP family transcriptional regulator [Micromonosporaceae bacterium]
MAPLQFGILGPVEIWLHNGASVPGAEPRTLLAALLLGANQVQRTDWLIECVWGDRPPAAAADRLSRHAGTLRRLLGRRLVTVDDTSYLLQVEPSQLDLSLFTEAVQRARVDLAARDYAGAAAGLRAALSLWRGCALSNVESRVLQEFEAPRLEEQRLSATEDRIEADLRLGQHTIVVGELRRLVAAHPLRERFCRHLIIAIYRCGDRDGALAAYAAAEQAMQALGVPPGPGLRQLALAVRTDHPSLGPPDGCG